MLGAATAGEVTDSGNWIDAIQGNRIYSICLSQAKINWKSPLQLALLGI